MAYNFDQIIDRYNTHSIKWDYTEKIFGYKDILPMWVADMDFKVPDEVTQALKSRVDHGIFGYTMESKEYFEGLINWWKKRHNWDIEKEWLQYTPGVIPGLNFSVQAFTNPGDKVIIQPPVYQPFFSAVTNNNRQLVLNPLKYSDQTYTMDLNDLEKKIDDQTKMMILCSPHNPVGRVWTQRELEELVDLCARHKLILISDEIHFDIIYSGNKHIPTASINDNAKNLTVTLSSPGKSFNIQGLHNAYALIANEDLRNTFKKTVSKSGIFLNNTMSITAGEAVYQYGEPWLDELLEYLEANRDFAINYIFEEMKRVYPIKPEGTYMLWLDFRKSGYNHEKVDELLLKKAKVGLNTGSMFGDEGENFQRLNFACPQQKLEEGLEKMAKVFK